MGKAGLVFLCLFLLLVGGLVGRYVFPECPQCPECPPCPECPQCPPPPPKPTITIEKWVKPDCWCEWQREISVQKGDWIQVRIVVNVTGTMDHVWVRDAALARGPWTKVQELRVDGVLIGGDITEGISLGELKDESREITFRAQLSKSTYRYNCGVNVLENVAEAGDCGYQVKASARIIVNVKCVTPPSSCCEPKPPAVKPPTVITIPPEN